MGFFSAFFGSGEESDDSNGWTSARNSAERQAMADHMSEQLSTGQDPIPTEPPSWAGDIPSPPSESDT